jgi:hypothetical protein
LWGTCRSAVKNQDELGIRDSSKSCEQAGSFGVHPPPSFILLLISMAWPRDSRSEDTPLCPAILKRSLRKLTITENIHADPPSQDKKGSITSSGFPKSRGGVLTLLKSATPCRICVRNQRYLYRPPLNGEIVLLGRGCRCDTELLQDKIPIIIFRVPLDLTLL